MAEDLRSAPVAIRLAVRYANGNVISYGARALAYDEKSLHILSSEDFEKGTTLKVLAPFLKGIATCRVAWTARRQSQYFEIVLRFAGKPGKVSSLIRSRPEADTGEQAAPQRPTQERATQIVRDEVAEAAERFADRLERTPSRRFSQVLAETPSALRSQFLLVAASATVLFLQEKGLLDSPRV